MRSWFSNKGWSISSLSLTIIKGKSVIPIYPLGTKYLEAISIITGKVAKFVHMSNQISGNKLIEGEDYYLSPEGYKVFTEKHHLKRGYCCKNGCRHCPYGYDKKSGALKK
jgi:hypothetical protein